MKGLKKGKLRSLSILSLTFLTVISLVYAATGRITQHRCVDVTAFKQITAWVDVSGGCLWLGCSVKDKKGSIKDIPAQKVCSSQNVNFEAPVSAVSYTLALWQNYNSKNDLMEGEVQRVDWTSCK